MTLRLWVDKIMNHNDHIGADSSSLLHALKHSLYQVSESNLKQFNQGLYAMLNTIVNC